MARNKLNDLRDHLFAQLERLNDEDLTPDEVKLEIGKAKAMTDISNSLIESAKVEVSFIKQTGKLGGSSNFWEPKQLDS